MVEGYTPYTFLGPALVNSLMSRTVQEMNSAGFSTLPELQSRIADKLRLRKNSSGLKLEKEV